MPTVTIDGRTIDVPAGTNLVDAAQDVGVQIWGNNTPWESYQLISFQLTAPIRSLLSVETLIRISIVLYSDVLPAHRLQQVTAWPKPRRVE